MPLFTAPLLPLLPCAHTVPLLSATLRQFFTSLMFTFIFPSLFSTRVFPFVLRPLHTQGMLNHSQPQALNKNKRLCFTWTVSP